MAWCIYALKDPRIQDVRYVGFTGNLIRRVGAHIAQASKDALAHSRKGIWLCQRTRPPGIEQRDRALRQAAEKTPVTELAEQYGVSRARIYQILARG